MSIRPYRRADGVRCAIIYLDARHVAFPWVPMEEFSVDDFIRDTADEEIAVAEGRIDGGETQVLGFVSVFTPGHFIHHLYIDPQHRRLGIGRALVRHAVAAPGGPWRLKCIMANVPAMAFYRSDGWVEEGRGEDGLGLYATLRYDRPARNGG